MDQFTKADVDKDWLQSMDNLDPFFQSAGDGADFESKNLLETELSMFADGIAFNPYEVNRVLQMLCLLCLPSSCANSVLARKQDLALCNCKSFGHQLMTPVSSAEYWICHLRSDENHSSLCS